MAEGRVGARAALAARESAQQAQFNGPSLPPCHAAGRGRPSTSTTRMRASSRRRRGVCWTS